MSNRKFLKSQIKIAKRAIKHLTDYERKAIEKSLRGKDDNSK
jgi:hypothetical protein